MRSGARPWGGVGIVKQNDGGTAPRVTPRAVGGRGGGRVEDWWLTVDGAKVGGEDRMTDEWLRGSGGGTDDWLMTERRRSGTGW